MNIFFFDVLTLTTTGKLVLIGKFGLYLSHFKRANS